MDEGDTAQFVVTLAPASGKQVTVSLFETADGTAKAPEDYTAASSTTLTFTAEGDTTKTDLGGDDRGHAGTRPPKRLR